MFDSWFIKTKFIQASTERDELIGLSRVTPNLLTGKLLKVHQI